MAAIATKNNKKKQSYAFEVVNLSSSDDDDDDDDISILYASPPSLKKEGKGKGTQTNNPIWVDDDDDDDEDDDDDDDLQVISWSAAKKEAIFKGESSNSSSNSKQKTFLCEICVDEKPKAETFQISGCIHFYCSDCMVKYVASKLQENITNIPCPAMGCRGGRLEPEKCRSILPAQVFDRWADVLCESLILGSEKYYYCPFKDCSALLIDERNIRNEVITQSECPYCRRLFCVECRAPWHPDIPCAEFKKLNDDEKQREDIMLFNLAKKEKWMRCPKCKFFVEKSEGCLYMKCRCNYAFCYNCGAQITGILHYCAKCMH